MSKFFWELLECVVSVSFYKEVFMPERLSASTMHDLDDFLLTAGRKFVKKVYQHKLQEQVERNETNIESKQCNNCKGNL